MSVREELELAAKAAGQKINAARQAERDALGLVDIGLWTEETTLWNPRNDDGQALRLANKLWLDVRHVHGKAHAGRPGIFWCTESWYPDGDQDAATREAIFQAAVKIGRVMP